jgi:hypothetical protein
MKRSLKSRAWRAAVSLLTGAVVFQLGFLDSCTGLLRVFNPCGTIFGFCEQEDLDLILADSLPDWDLDPTCTIPFAAGGGCAGGPIWPTPGPRPD